MALNVTLNFKKELQKGKVVFGQTIGPRNDPEKTVQALKGFGFDFIMMETEHSLVNKETIFEYIRVSRKLKSLSACTVFSGSFPGPMVCPKTILPFCSCFLKLSVTFSAI